jgi:hypothetical protein
MSIPGSANPLLLASAAAASGYQIERSVRLNAPDSAYFSRTPSSAGNRKTWTWSGWVKKSGFGLTQPLFNAHSSGSLRFRIFFTPSETLAIDSDATAGINLITTQVFRDPSAWFHLLVAMDTAQATAANRCKVYVNGVEITSFSTSSYPVLNAEFSINSTVVAHQIGAETINSVYFSGYLANVEFVDGQQLTPSSFGEFDANGVWQPKAYSGPTPTGNSSWLPFSDNSAATATTLGKDGFNLGNNWTPNNLSVTAGAGNDSLVDSPTNYGTDTGAGGEVRGNYCTLNPLQNTGNTLSNGSLDVSIAGTNWTGSTVAMTTGKWYTEFTVGSTGIIQMFGVCNADFYGTGGNAPWITPGAKEVTYYVSDGRVYVDGVNTGTTSGATAGDIISFAFDADARSVAIRKNNTLLATKTITASAAGYIFYVSSGGGSCTATLNYGARSFAYTAPSGFKALCTANLPTPTIANGATAMDVKLYTGNGSTQTISGLNFSPDLVWIKARSSAQTHVLMDTVRGTSSQLFSNLTNAEGAQTDQITAFNSDGFALGANVAGTGRVNTSSVTYAGWCWDAGSSTVTNTQGSITSQVRANASAGFSIVTYTAPASNTFTVGHGLGVAPGFILVKGRNQAYNWDVYHQSLGATGRLILNTTSDFITTSGPWANTPPTSSVFSSSGNGVYYNNGDTLVAYCFAPVVGYSSFGSYTGNGSADGPFVYTGFRPALVIVKMSSSTGNWIILDDKRLGYNVDNNPLFPNLSNAEGTTDLIDITSNGFKVRTTDATFNTNAGTYIYAAWASSPFAYARAR